MHKGLVFILGFIAGAVVTFFFLFIVVSIMNSRHEGDHVQIQFVTVKGKKGNAELYTGMEKDSVELLVGKPEDVDLNSYGYHTHEVWGYKLKNKYMPDLRIEFEDGRLTGVRQD